MKTWNFILSKLKSKQSVVLLYVLMSKGSSPGRKGFKMAITDDGEFIGTIGGGIMEVKLLELAKNKLLKKDKKIIIKQQFHDKSHAINQSGMICSGEQIVAIIPLDEKDISILDLIVNKKGESVKLSIDKNGFKLVDDSQKELLINIADKENFKAIFSLNAQKRVHVFGGGHVGLTLSQVLSLIDYYIIIYDDRPDLNTLKQNHFAHDKRVIDYGDIDKYCQFNSNDAVVIVTFSYRSDKLILKQLYPKPFSYIGMMGSDSKIKTLLDELSEEGISAKELSHVFTPIGLNIYSKTAMEIAVSIAGQMILEKNKLLPTGRNY